MSDSPLGPEAPEPPRREFKFKATEFERTNRPLDEADSKPPIDVRELFKSSTVARPPSLAQPATPPPPKAPVPAANDVHAILQANLDRANAEGHNDVSLKPKRASRRKRDYWMLLIGTNLFFLICMAVAPNIGTLIFGGAGIILVSIGLTWIMWFVMDDY